MIKIAKLATTHMFDENNPEDSDYELWKGIAEYMDGEDAYVVESTAMEGKYVFLGLCDRNKDKELAYMMEQDSMTGIFIDDREEFEAVWESNEYEHEGCFCIEPKWIEAFTHLEEKVMNNRCKEEQETLKGCSGECDYCEDAETCEQSGYCKGAEG